MYSRYFSTIGFSYRERQEFESLCVMFEPEPEPPKIQFRIIGIVASPEFQLCRRYIERLAKSFPREYEELDVRSLLDVEWQAFLIKLKRKIGGEKMWALDRSVVVFMNDELLGDDADLLKFIAVKYRLSIVKDYEKIGKQQLLQHLAKQSDLGRHFVYLTISVDDKVVGSMLFQLYSDLVPLISNIFLKRCKKKRGGYAGTPIQRIVKPSWIQCGGWNLKHHKLPCENYVIPHDRRGVLSMCHNGKHEDNSTQFFITLDPTPWMDYKYVAFGQLIHGEDILKLLESIPTNYEAPTKKIEIVKADEYNYYPTREPKDMVELDRYLAKKDLEEDIIDPRDVNSVMLRRRFKRGLYSAETDMRGYLPFLHLPDYLIYKYLVAEKLKEEDVAEECFDEVKTVDELFMHEKAKESARFGGLN